MESKEIAGVSFGYEFTKPEFAVIARNLREFAHPAISAEIRANSQNTTFGRKVNLYAAVRHERSVRHGIVAKNNTIGRLRQERDQIRALLASEAPLEKERQTNVVLGMFTTQAAFEQLAEPIRTLSPNLYEPDQLIAMRNVFLAESPLG